MGSFHTLSLRWVFVSHLLTACPTVKHGMHLLSPQPSIGMNPTQPHSHAGDHTGLLVLTQVTWRLQQLHKVKAHVQRSLHFQGSCITFAGTCRDKNLEQHLYILYMLAKMWSCHAQRLFTAHIACSSMHLARSLMLFFTGKGTQQFW